MIAALRAKAGELRRGGRINRAPSPWLARSVPWLLVMAASVIPSWFIISSAPVMPPFGFLVLIAWRQLRPGLLPTWAGLPLGLFDDLYSGQPFGSGILLWSLAIIFLDIVEARFPWRNFALEWLVGGAVIAAYILACLAFANAAGGATPLLVVVPQMVVSMLFYPLVERMVAMFDRLRLMPLRKS
ncbi:MAG: rod shape-determining protein MreD [Novosphingobium sp.]|nr:rod shape-determining protein MreD [Novosphingobium sp.]